MKIYKTAFALGLAATFMIAGNAFALSYSNNITIYDGLGGATEDGEVEPGCVNSQVWDLEGFFLKGANLTMVGGFDFVNGVDGYDKYTSGDIFIDIDGDAQYGSSNTGGGSGQSTVNNTFGYDYVLDMDFASLTYSVIKLNDSTTTTVWYSQNEESNPWLYAAGGDLLTGYENLSMEYDAGVTDAESGFGGGNHYAVGVDLSFLAPGTDFTSHFTMGCGNDNLMGHGTAPVPEPATMLLFGTGLAGLAGFSKKRFNKA
jgi:hypothetical protein